MAQTKEERAAYMRRYQERHAERLKAYQREWYEANRDQKIARSDCGRSRPCSCGTGWKRVAYGRG